MVCKIFNASLTLLGYFEAIQTVKHQHALLWPARKRMWAVTQEINLRRLQTDTKIVFGGEGVGTKEETVLKPKQY